MKVLIVHYRYFISGGPERYLFNVKKALEDRGHEVIPFSIHNSKNVETVYEKYFVDNIGKSDEVFVNKYPRTLQTYIDLIGREFYSFKVYRALEKLVKEEKPDVCYLLVYKRALSPSVIDVCKKYGIPVINRISDYNTVCGAGGLYRSGKYCDLCLESSINCLKYNCVKGNKIFSLMRFLSIKFHTFLGFQNKVDDYICTNGYMAEMMEKYGYEKRKLHVIPTFFKESQETASLNKTNSVEDGFVNFLFIGNIDETKGIYDLLRALAELNKIRSNFHVFIVGGLHADENQKVQDIVKAGNLQKKITFVPFIKSNEVFKYYIKSNVTVLPTRWVENLPNTLIESIYFNRPVIVPDYGSFKFTTDESVAFKFEALNYHALFECMNMICENPVLIEEKSKNCADFFLNNFSEKKHMEKLLHIMEEKLNENI